MNSHQWERARQLLCSLQNAISAAVLTARERSRGKLSRIAAVTAADTIYGIDRIGERAILPWFEKRWPRAWPIELVMEGVEDSESVTFPRGTPVARTALKCILDPIDGTRGLMHDKRSAWVLSAIAPQKGKKTGLRDIVVAAMTELPASKQWRADQFSSVRGGGPRGVVARAYDVRNGTAGPIEVRPSQARGFEQGFSSLVRFFPEGKALTAEIEEELWRCVGASKAGEPTQIFDDQYLSTGGQLVELLVGHDRMVGDIRPLVYRKIGASRGLTCHPYDICGALILQEAGAVVETPLGRKLDAPLDTTTAVAWVGYANSTLAKIARPALRRALRKYL
jgi:fructose-1,6-bisphosphatase/inositol monophosphatase family enzyme